MQLDKVLKDVCDKSLCLYTKAEIDIALGNMAKEMNVKLANSNPIFLCVLLGAVVPMGSLLPLLNFRLEIDYIHFSSYRAENKMDELILKTEPSSDFSGRTVVIFDDILDTSITLKAAIEYCKKRQAKDVYTAVLVDKQKSEPRVANGVERADFTALTVNDVFVFGYGLDYLGYLRNLPGIYTLDDKIKS